MMSTFSSQLGHVTLQRVTSADVSAAEWKTLALLGTSNSKVPSKKPYRKGWSYDNLGNTDNFQPHSPVLRDRGPASCFLTAQIILSLILWFALAVSVDTLDLDGNMVAKMITGFTWMMNLTSIVVCLPTLRLAEDPLPISVQDINKSLTLKLTWEQCNHYIWRFRETKGRAYTYISCGWLLGMTDAGLAIIFSSLPIKPWGGPWMAPCHAPRFHGELLNTALYGMLMIIL